MIKLLSLTDFRNFKNKTLEFSGKITVIVGPNAAGKTNILESLSLLSIGKSFKAKLEVEMIGYKISLLRVTGILSQSVCPVRSSSRSTSSIGTAGAQRDSLRFRHPSLEIVITTSESGWPRKKLLVNGIPKRMVDFAGNFRTVLFGPWDMDIVTGSPSIRRKFLDNVLSQTDREYRRSILSYEKGLRQRNKLLFRIREEEVPRSQLLFWDQLLIKSGNYITNSREKFIEFVNSLGKLRLEYDKSIISEGRLEQYKAEEVAAATTLVGPHRDDFIFYDGDRNLDSYGSRGEQRIGVLRLKMAELDYIENLTGERPTLLLDDTLSELDHNHRKIVMDLATKQQTIITTADEHFIEGFKDNNNKIIKL